jgi:hypothetical protein
LIAIHGAEALAVAERAANNVRKLEMKQALDKWKLVIAAIKKIQLPQTKP